MRIFFAFIVLILFSSPVLSQEETPGEKAYGDGFMNLLMGEFEEAETNFTKAIAEKEQLATSYYMRAKALGGQRKYQAALIDVSESLKIDSKDLSVLMLRGQIYLALDEPVKALPDLKEVCNVDSTYENVRFFLGRAYYEMAQYEKAIPELDQAIIQDPEDGATFGLRGFCHLKLDMNDEACNDLSKARKLGAPRLDEVILSNCGDVEINPDNQTTEYDWNLYPNPDHVDATNADYYDAFSTYDPESMVQYFYASKIRGDSKWRDVLQPENQWSRRMNYSLEKYEHWKFTKFHLVKKKRHSENGWWIMVYFEIEVNGEKDGGNDEVSLEFNGTEWIITEVPN